MKTHAIIPIFVPHAGCPHDCVFCDQRAITARVSPPSAEETEATITRNLRTIRQNSNIRTVEIAFYGGSFTGIPVEEQNMYLEIARKYKQCGDVDRIHLSTRPDYIDPVILQNLKNHGVDIIELGVQSFDQAVLDASARGHDTETVRKSAALIKEFGFELGIQLMTGLPGDNLEKSVKSAMETVKIGPAIARIYPTVVLENTALAAMYREGRYTPPDLEETVQTVKKMYRILTESGINVIRIGLKSTDIIRNENGAVVGGYHPAMRQLVQGALARDILEDQVQAIVESHACRRISFFCSPAAFSDMVGNRKCNRIYFERKYPEIEFRFAVDDSMEAGSFIAKMIR